jgi:hypothetical protein
LVCVVDNRPHMPFDAAMYIPDQYELERARVRPLEDHRPRRWLIVPGAADLSGYSRYNR